MFRSTGLWFADGIREVSSLHFSSTTTEICECKSSCNKNSYDDGGGCVECPAHSGTQNNGSFSVDQCLCVAEYECSDEDPAVRCVPVRVDIYEYNYAELILKGHCTKSLEWITYRSCMTQTAARKELDGCSCDDSCLFWKPGMDELRCCRNKCTLCGASQDSRSLCNCQYDPVSMRAYNRASVSGELCSGYQCAPGEQSTMGMCIKCPKGRYQDESRNMASEACKSCEPCSIGKYRAGCGMANPGACRRCTTCTSDQVETQPCSALSDTVCSSSTDCTKFGVQCPTGSYHAGCDPTIGEKGWCERCSIQHALECPSKFFLNFQCTHGSPLTPHYTWHRHRRTIMYTKRVYTMQPLPMQTNRRPVLPNRQRLWWSGIYQGPNSDHMHRYMHKTCHGTVDPAHVSVIHSKQDQHRIYRIGADIL